MHALFYRKGVNHAGLSAADKLIHRGKEKSDRPRHPFFAPMPLLDIVTYVFVLFSRSGALTASKKSATSAPARTRATTTWLEETRSHPAATSAWTSRRAPPTTSWRTTTAPTSGTRSPAATTREETTTPSGTSFAFSLEVEGEGEDSSAVTLQS